MATFATDASSLTTRFLEELPAILADARHTEIWGVNLQNAEPLIIEKILHKFLDKNTALPSLQLSRANASLTAALRWRRYKEPRALLQEAVALLPGLGLCYITECEGRFVLWVTLDEMVIKGHAPIHQVFETSNGILKMGLAVLEHLSSRLIHSDMTQRLDPDGSSASCVIEFKIHAPSERHGGRRQTQKKLIGALEELATVIRTLYPGIFRDAFIINPAAEYLATLDIPERLLRNTVLLETPEPLVECDCLGSVTKTHSESDAQTTAPNTNTTDVKPSSMGEVLAASTTDPETEPSVAVEPDHPEPRLIYSETIGPPTIIFDPDDLQTADDVCSGKMGARLVFAESDIVVKLGHGVRLAEAEAMHLVSTRTSISVPKLISAYILDGVGYIAMSYEMGEPFEHYWARVSEEEQTRILNQLHGYVSKLREIEGDTIGGIGGEPCRDGIFEAGYGDYMKYSYGPYPPEESFNEGMVQALRDRLPQEVLRGENDKESVFFTAEYFLYQTVRSLKNHGIVLTHGDLHPGNMLVQADGTVVILDWGLAGFWPEYWEFYRALFTASWRTSWERMVEKFVPPYYVEYSVINKVFATVWN
ncbi:kinase-like domain-containing protein [Aspergillus carlsbadensis]|nr:kinase-like domain-containing protein [Aspergillus carlsbadensis]